MHGRCHACRMLVMRGRDPRLVDQTNDLSNPVTSNSVPTPQESKVVKNDNVIAPGVFRINPSKTSREDKFMPINKVRASVRTNPITISQLYVITKKDVNSDSNGLSSTGVDNTPKTRRPQPKSNPKNDRLPSKSSSCIKNKEVEVKEHPRNLLLFKNKKHMSSECNNVKLAIRNDNSEVVCAICKQCLITANHDVCVLNYVNGMKSTNISKTANQKKHKPQVKKPKKVGSKERLASPKPSKPRICLRWSPTARIFDLCRKIIESSDSKCKSDTSVCDDENASNPLEPIIKRFPNSTSFLGRLSKFFYVRFGNDHVAAILGFGDLQWGNILITTVYFIEGLGHNLFLAGQFCDSDLELWHQRLSYLNFDTINDLAKNNLVTGLPKFKYHKEHLCPSCEQGKSKRASYPPKLVPNSKQRLHLLHMDLCGPMRIASINGKRKPDISFLHVFGALCYPKNDREDIGKLGAKGDIGFFIGYSADSCAYRVYNRRTKKIMKTMYVTFDELSAMAFAQSSSKPGLQGMTSGQISSGLDLTYASSTITTQQPNEHELYLLFEVMYDDYIGGQPSASPRTIPDAQAPQPETVADNVLDAMLDGNTFVNPFATPSTSSAESSSSQYVDPSNMHTTMEPKNVKEAMTDPAWIESMQEELLQFKRLDVWVLVPALDNIKPLTLKWLFKNKHDEENTVTRNKTRLVVRGYR
ncbi:integrase, catalytic region, zinc finger, CCHC-type containing protein [Tanacetum coccineum]